VRLKASLRIAARTIHLLEFTIVRPPGVGERRLHYLRHVRVRRNGATVSGCS
jgi:hypothetical protein